MNFLHKPYVMVGRAQEKFDKEGNLTDEDTMRHIKKQIDAFQNWINRLN